jgi:hypothetical protein
MPIDKLKISRQQNEKMKRSANKKTAFPAHTTSSYQQQFLPHSVVGLNMPPPPPSVLRARAAVWHIQQSLFPQQHVRGATELPGPPPPNYQMPNVFSNPSNDLPRCPACNALVNVPNNVSKFRCPYCSVQLDVSDDDGATEEEEVNEVFFYVDYAFVFVMLLVIYNLARQF